jgi:hypothetical protein
MKPRGSVVLVAMVMLALLVLGAGIIGFAAASRLRVQVADTQRETAIRSAESTLERARLALNEGKLRVGDSFDADGLSVTCTRTGENAIHLETVAPCPLNNRRRAAPVKPQTSVRVIWELLQRTDSGLAPRWRLSAWQARNEAPR